MSLSSASEQDLKLIEAMQDHGQTLDEALEEVQADFSEMQDEFVEKLVKERGWKPKKAVQLAIHYCEDIDCYDSVEEALEDLVCE